MIQSLWVEVLLSWATWRKMDTTPLFLATCFTQVGPSHKAIPVNTFLSYSLLLFLLHLHSTGSHLKSIKMILDNKADVAAIDSNVLKFYLQQNPQDKENLSTVTSLGPMPIYPIVFNSQLSGKLVDPVFFSSYLHFTQINWLYFHYWLRSWCCHDSAGTFLFQGSKMCPGLMIIWCLTWTYKTWYKIEIHAMFMN